MAFIITSDLRVSTDKNILGYFFLNLVTTFSNLLHSILDGISFDPGLVDSPPTSMIFAPLSTMVLMCKKALWGLLNKPPSEKLSGVKFKMPIINGSENFKFLFKFDLLSTIFLISFWTIFFMTLFNRLIFLTWMTLLWFFLDRISIWSKAKFLFPQSGNANFFLIKFFARKPW